MIAVHCAGCGHELTEPGGLLFSPPDDDGMVAKLHLCTTCFVRVAVSLAVG